MIYISIVGDRMAEERARLWRGSGMRRAVMVFLIVVCLGAISTSIFFYHQAKNDDKAEHKRLVAQLSKSIQLPAGEPAIITIADKNKLTNRSLASRVENGDTLLIYSNVKRLIVYRPSIKKVTDMLTIETTKLPASGQKQNESGAKLP